MHNTVSRSQFRTLSPRDSAAPVAGLSRAKREALLQCLHGAYLLKYASGWRAPNADFNIASVTVTSLAKDGLLTLGSVQGTNAGLNRATLSTRGLWFARTLNTQKQDDI